jgi:para-nitrobenzyl esterase
MALPIEKLLAVQQELGAKMIIRTLFEPVIDGKILKHKPMIDIDAGSAAGIPVLCGNTLEEWKLFGSFAPGIKDMDEARMKKDLQTIIKPEQVDPFVTTYRNARAKRGLPVTPFELFSAIETDRSFRVPAILIAEAQHCHHQAAYNYIFTWKSPKMGDRYGACHILDVGFTFGHYQNDFNGTGPKADKLSQNIQDAWLTFARTGNPSCESVGKWPKYGAERNTMLLNAECHVEKKFWEEERRLWEGFEEF